jgi:hypothetical protein
MIFFYVQLVSKFVTFLQQTIDLHKIYNEKIETSIKGTTLCFSDC